MDTPELTTKLFGAWLVQYLPIRSAQVFFVVMIRKLLPLLPSQALQGRQVLLDLVLVGHSHGAQSLESAGFLLSRWMWCCVCLCVCVCVCVCGCVLARAAARAFEIFILRPHIRLITCFASPIHNMHSPATYSANNLIRRGFLSKRESSARAEHVLVVCTHRPSLLPTERVFPGSRAL